MIVRVYLNNMYHNYFLLIYIEMYCLFMILSRDNIFIIASVSEFVFFFWKKHFFVPKYFLICIKTRQK